MKRVCDLTVHLFNFKQLDILFEGSYKLRFSIEANVDDIQVTGEPYLLPKESRSELLGKYFITEGFTPGKNTNKLLNDMCTFRVEVPYLEDLRANSEKVASKVRIKVDLMMFGLKGTALGKKYPPNKNGFSILESNILDVRKIWKGVHEYSEVNFSEVVFCTGSLAIHSDLVDFDFDTKFLNPGLKSIPLNSN